MWRKQSVRKKLEYNRQHVEKDVGPQWLQQGAAADSKLVRVHQNPWVGPHLAQEQHGAGGEPTAHVRSFKGPTKGKKPQLGSGSSARYTGASSSCLHTLKHLSNPQQLWNIPLNPSTPRGFHK
ncbi:hypothetical protein Y1Q_0007324 [Alligator mississippiensis]|uniref:Uncharacterized protein n=1 Tax=Alligator mississippiensis TaxID=8496 RepID=A0A151P7K4_ALLMI|nr:hypothetical protein Y1Q_0007324 [Alligator mississippiensis]